MFGLLMGCGFFALGYILYKELKRKEQLGILKSTSKQVWEGKGVNINDVISNGIFGFVLGFKIPEIVMNFADFKDDAAGFVFSSRGNLLFGLLGLISFGGFSYWKGQQSKTEQPKQVTRVTHPHERVGDIIVLAAIFGILGSRLFSILENMDTFLKDPIGQLFSGSGLTIYGGFILATIAIAYYVRKNGMPAIHVADAIAPALILGYGIGRLGCQISGDGDWGIVNELAKPGWFFLPDWMWAYDYPNNVLNEGVTIDGCSDKYCSKLSPSVFPTPIYEVITSGIIFLILWFNRQKITKAGVMFSLYLTLMSVARFAVEHIRVNPRYNVAGLELSQAQLISIGLFAIGVFGLYYFKKKDNKLIF
jgi:prolipoprotein diacylglyceryl transferase